MPVLVEETRALNQNVFASLQVRLTSFPIIRFYYKITALLLLSQISDHSDKHAHGHTVNCFELADECKIADMQVQISAFLESPGRRLTSEPWSTY